MKKFYKQPSISWISTFSTIMRASSIVFMRCWSKNFVFFWFLLKSFNFNFNYHEPSKKHLELILIIEKTYLKLFDNSIKDCEKLLKGRIYFRNYNKDDMDVKTVVTKKLKMYYILILHSSFYEYVDKSLELLYNITNILHDKHFNLPFDKTLNELKS